MDEQINKKMTDDFLDAAAGEALGANTAAESAAYPQELAASGVAAQRVDRELRETVSRLAATSPYMKPPVDLRGRILQATAPQTFRMEDYRKANRDTGGFYKWAFYAAMLFLAAGAWYNLRISSNLNTANQQIAQLTQAVGQRDTAIRSLVDPSAKQIQMMDDRHLSGRIAVDEKNQTAVVVVPEHVIPPGQGLQLTLPGPQQQRVPYRTIVVEVPPDIFPQANREQLRAALNVKDLQPAPENVFNATMWK